MEAAVWPLTTAEVVTSTSRQRICLTLIPGLSQLVFGGDERVWGSANAFRICLCLDENRILSLLVVLGFHLALWGLTLPNSFNLGATCLHQTCWFSP